MSDVWSPNQIKWMSDQIWSWIMSLLCVDMSVSLLCVDMSVSLLCVDMSVSLMYNNDLEN
jgi:hypothetical protein